MVSSHRYDRGLVEMKRARTENHVGTGSLIVAVGGAFGCHLATSVGIVSEGAVLAVIRAGFEAATVGGLADWFAVTALFRHPLGLPIPHTAIVRKRRKQIIDGIVAVFEEEWLTPDVIEGRVARLHLGDMLVSWLSDPARVRAAEAPVRDVLRGLTALLSEKEVVEEADRLLRLQLGRFPLASRAGAWLSGAAASPTMEQAFDAVTRSMAEVARRPETALRLRDWMDRSSIHLEEKGRRIASLLMRSDAVQRRAAEAACRYLASELDYAAVERDHPLREALHTAVSRFAERLVLGEPEAVGRIERLRAAFLESLHGEPMAKLPLAELKAHLVRELDDPESALVGSAIERLRALALRVLADRENLSAFEGFCKSFAGDLVRRYHHQIGITLRESLESMDTDTLTAQVEERLGPDLQYIRLNGAVVGGAIGVLLALIRLLLV